MKLSKTVFSAANRALDPICKTPRAQIPLDEIFNSLESRGLIPLQEDGTKWSGILCGNEGRATIEIADALTRNKPLKNHCLIITWYKLPVTGNFETVAYIS